MMKSVLILCFIHYSSVLFSQHTEDPRLFNNPYAELLLIRYIPTQGEWGGTTDTIRIYRSNDCSDTVGGNRINCRPLMADIYSMERVFFGDTMIILHRNSIDSVRINEPIEKLMIQSINEISDGAKKLFPQDMMLAPYSKYEVSMSLPKLGLSYFKLTSIMYDNNSKSFTELKKIITQANNAQSQR